MQESEQEKMKVPRIVKSLEDSKAPMWIALVLILMMIGGGIYNIIYNLRTW